MGPKCKLIVRIVLALLFSIILLITIYNATSKKQEDYTSKLISVLNKQGMSTVQDIFSFKFERAYVFNDCYISGEGFAKRYNLNISINEVESGVSENIQRIVFVDESGDFVYEFKCDSNEVVLQEKGILIYPETAIARESSAQEKILIINFQSSEHYDQSVTHDTGDG